MVFRLAVLFLSVAALATEFGSEVTLLIHPAAHTAFLSWARKSDFARVEPAGIPTENYSWSLLDSSANEYLYRLNYPIEGGRIIRVFHHAGEWQAVEDPWLNSVGRFSWQEILALRLPQEIRSSGGQIQVLLEKDDLVIVALVRQENPEGGGALEMYHFTKGPDRLWRSYRIYDGVDSTYASPEDALVAFARQNFSTLAIGGDCPSGQHKQTGKVCWTLKEQTPDRRVYEVSPAFHSGNTIELERYLRGWLGRPYELFPPIDSFPDEDLSVRNPG